jgi:hypothetical protein
MMVREVNKKKRLSWCLERRRWTVNLHWNQVIFSDESQIVIGQNNRVQRRFKSIRENKMVDVNEFELLLFAPLKYTR